VSKAEEQAFIDRGEGDKIDIHGIGSILKEIISATTSIGLALSLRR